MTRHERLATESEEAANRGNIKEPDDMTRMLAGNYINPEKEQSGIQTGSSLLMVLSKNLCNLYVPLRFLDIFIHRLMLN